MSLYKVGEVWYYYITVRGKRIRKSAETTDRDAAALIEAQAKIALKAGSRESGVTWEDACSKWLKAEKRSTVDYYILGALDYPNRPLAQCTAESFAPVLAGRTAGTHNRYCNLIQAILNLSGHKIKIPRRKPPKGRIRWLTEDEWLRLYAALPAHLKPIAAFSIATGLRQANALQLEWSQIDLKRKVMWVYADQAKGKEPIGLPLNDDAVKVLRGQLGQDKRFVFTYNKKPMADIKTGWQSAMERAGLGHFEYDGLTPKGYKKKKWVGDFTWHGLRHTWASWHVMNGTRLEELQQLGGWKTLEMVQVYAHLAPEHLASVSGNCKPYAPYVHAIAN